MIAISRRQGVFCEKDVLRNLTKFTGKHLCQKRDSDAGVSCEFCEISKNTFSYRTPLVAASGLVLNSSLRITISIVWRRARSKECIINLLGSLQLTKSSISKLSLSVSLTVFRKQCSGLWRETLNLMVFFIITNHNFFIEFIQIIFKKLNFFSDFKSSIKTNWYLHYNFIINNGVAPV